jgi:hypothetical protein
MTQNSDLRIESGYFIAMKYEFLYPFYLENYSEKLSGYSIPQKHIEWHQMSIQYQGLDRERGAYPHASDPQEKMRASLLDLQDKKSALNSLIFSQKCAQDLIALSTLPEIYEILWARRPSSAQPLPTGYQSLGWEAGDFTYGSSLVSEAMHFPRWSGTDQDGTLYLKFYRQLNESGLFRTSSEAQAFADSYLENQLEKNPSRAARPPSLFEVFKLAPFAAPGR